MTNQVQTTPDDSKIKRNREWRYFVFAISAAVILVTGYFGARLIAHSLFKVTLITNLSGILGLGTAAAFGGYLLILRSIITNRTTRAFVTIDSLKSFLGKSDVHVVYGPGTHLALWWESRPKANTINLEEASQDFEFKVQCLDGVLFGKGSFRLRPDINRPVPFLTGVAAMAKELTDLIVAKINPRLAKMSLAEGMADLKELNDMLETQFVHNLSAFEERFGVEVGDITVKELLPSEAVQKTIAGISEAVAIARGTAALLGMSEVGVTRALNGGKLSRADYNIARDRFMAISGNLEGMEIKRNEYTITISGLADLDPEAASAITSAAQAYLAAKGVAGRSNQKSSKPKT